MTCTTSALTHYQIGQMVHLTCLFEKAGVDTDPPVVTCVVEFPSSDIDTVYTYGVDADILRKDSTGNYSCFISATIPGLHTYKWFATDANTPIYQRVQGAKEGQFIVDDSVIG